ncbi:MAG: DUF3048 domain-containing protein [Chloroflexota bacterium]
MRCLWYSPLLLVLALLTLAACAGDSPPPGNPTPELAVVVFATEEPTATATSAVAAASPTAAATVGMGVSLTRTEEKASEAGAVSSAANRAPDVNPLTGLKVDDPALLNRRPLMVRVGNDPAARPQVALNEADVVYEELVEWWVTRFTAIYLSQEPEMIAPIRSARLINLYLTPQYQGVLLNSGGSDPVRWELSQSDIINLDEFFVPQPYFYRENEGWQTRLAVDATAARTYLAEESLDSKVQLRGFEFSSTLDLSGLPQEAVGEAQEAVIPYPAQTSEARWQYDPARGQYLRFTSGEPLLDNESRPLAASNVIIYFAEHLPTDIVEDSNGATSIRIVMNGLGTAWLLRDGKILKGNWQTDGRQTPEFIFNDGRALPLKPGNTWVNVVPVEYEIEIDGVAHSRLGAAAADEATVETEEAKPTAAPSPTLTPIGFRARPTPEATAAP